MKRSDQSKLQGSSKSASMHAVAVSSASDGTFKRHIQNPESLQHGRQLVRGAWRTAIQSGDICVDATCGRGSDTLELARLAGPDGLVHALDIQQAAVDTTIRRVMETQAENNDVRLARVNAIVKNHADFNELEHVHPRSVGAIVYNLGWFPANGADRTIITTPATTISSLCAAGDIVRVGGVITVTVYTGHEGGKEEGLAVHEWVKGLPSKSWSVAHVNYPNRLEAPQVYVIVRVGDS